MASIKIYTKPDCGACEKAKAFLGERGLSFEAVDVAADPDAFGEMVRKSDQAFVPVIEIDGQVLCGFSPRRLGEILD